MLPGVGAAAAFGGGDFTGGLAARRNGVFLVAASTQLVGLVVLLGAIVILNPGAPPPASVLLGVGCGLVSGLAVAALYGGLATGNMGLVATLCGVGSAAIPVGLEAVLGWGHPSAIQLAGVVAAISAGVVATSATVRGQIAGRSVVLGVAAAIGFGLAFMLLALVHQGGHVLWTLAVAKTVAASFLGGVAVVKRSRVPARRTLALIGIAGTLDVGASLMLLLAIGGIGVGMAASVAGVYPVVTALLAHYLLSERPPPRAYVAIALAATGILLITVGAPG